jgi:hypothetical protein
VTRAATLSMLMASLLGAAGGVALGQMVADALL